MKELPKSTWRWLLAFVLPGMALAATYTGLVAPGGHWSPGVYTLVLAGLGGIAGLFLYYITRPFHRRAKISIGIAFCMALIGGHFLIPSPSESPTLPPPPGSEPTPEPQLVTCRVCGYRSIGPDSLLCPVCAVELSEKERIQWEYRSMEEMVQEEQAMFFAAEGFQDSVSFFAPPVWESEGVSYVKDTSWRPVISTTRVLALRDTLIQAGVIKK